MMGRTFCVMVALGIIVGLGSVVHAELYLWTDELGVVHMTDQWAKVPEAARARVSVRESSPTSQEGPQVTGRATPAVEPLTAKRAPLQIAPDLVPTPPAPTPVPPAVLDSGESSWFIPRHRPFVHRPKKPSPPFPHNVRLDPFDSNFVWVGRSRVPKDAFTFPRVSLDAQRQFQNRLRMLEQRRSPPRTTLRGHPARR